MKQVLIIGAGAAGLMAAYQAAGAGAAVTVLEAKKKPGTKLLRTGNGRCNFTNLGNPAGRYHGSDPSFAQKALASWSAEDTVACFKDLGVLPYIKDGWVYPHSEQAQTILNALLNQLTRLKVKIKLNEEARSFKRQNGGFLVNTGGWQYRADALILTCGTGASVREDQQIREDDLLSSLDYVPPRPALCPLLVKDKRAALWTGVRVHARASLFADGKALHEEDGQIQFTAKGISGIPIFNMSYRAGQALSLGQKTEVALDLVPQMGEEDLAVFLTDHFYLNGIIPEKLALTMKDLTDPREAARRLKQYRIPISGLAPRDQAQVLTGGLATGQFDRKTMEHREVPGLFAAGELLDIDGECGGWNLQFAWASGAIAGKNAAEV